MKLDMRNFLCLNSLRGHFTSGHKYIFWDNFSKFSPEKEVLDNDVYTKYTYTHTRRLHGGE